MTHFIEKINIEISKDFHIRFHRERKIIKLSFKRININDTNSQPSNQNFMFSEQILQK